MPCQQLVDDFPKRSQFMTVDSLVEFFKFRTRGVLILIQVNIFSKVLVRKTLSEEKL